MRNYISILFIAFVLSLTSCRQDFDFEPSTGGLEFSKQTVYLDTVFSNIGSSTYTLKVYNNSDKDIEIPTLKLAQGENSKYRLMVDGIPGKVFNNVELLAKDSMFIFIETTIDYSEYANPDSEYLYTDQIEFHNISGAPQTVDLVTLVRDAYFLYPKRDSEGMYETIPINGEQVYGFFLDHNDPVNGDEYHWNNTKPYVIYGFAAVPENEILNIDPGAKIHFHADSGLIIGSNATINSIGAFSDYDAEGNVLADNEIVFESDRLEPDFADVPGQWLAIYMTEDSNGTFKNTTIKNAAVGLLIDNNAGTVNLNEVQIYNCSDFGILARTATINGKNVVINNCGQAGLACSLGGSYDFTHCTFANYWSRPNQVPVYLDNGTAENPFALTNANFTNCIVYGSSSYGISLKNEGAAAFNYNFRNCLIKFVDFGQFADDPLYPIANTANYPGCIIAESSTTNKPDFKNPSKNQLIIGDNSAAKGTADPAFSTFNDILDIPRNGVTTDMGAYNHIVFPN